MGCGCGRKISKSKRSRAKNSATNKKTGNVIRKRRVSKLISVPGRSLGKKVKK